MPTLTIATAATSSPMGAEVYQAEIASRAEAALAASGSDWRVRRVVARSLRSPLAGNRRLPMGALLKGGPALRRAVGRVLYPRGVVHRMNLELPPPSGADVVTLHDVVAWRFPDEAPPARAAAEELRAADAVICVSEFSAQEAVDLIGVRDPVVVHNGVNPRFFDASPLSEPRLQELAVRGPYVLTAGGAARRKNLAALAEAWPRIHREHPDLTLVLSGPPHPDRTRLFEHLPDVRLVGRVPAELVPGLVAGARAVVVPSTYEGFGLPALEAMAANTPLVAANTSSLPEVVGDGGRLVPPTGEGVAEGVLDVLRSDGDVAAMVARGRARAAGFTWERSAAGHARVWARLA